MYGNDVSKKLTIDVGLKGGGAAETVAGKNHDAVLDL